ncbi:MAG: beta-lactamase family protein [Burkholderiaceae bacterium]|nr:beta-lactamase family protein [Burkholderiaceae bacterium]
MNQPFLPAMPTRRLALVAALALVACGLLGSPDRASAQALPAAKPEELGLSPTGLAKIGDWMRAEVAAKKIPGATIMIVRGGKLAYAETVGVRDPASGAPLKADDIFRIYSMTKPIVSIAAMMLVEEGKLNLDAPVTSWIPAFADVKVGVETTDAIGRKTLEIVEAQRPMTVRDLMRHTSGLTYGFFGTGLVKQAYRDAAITAEGNVDNARFADAIARLPLAYQPGSTWDYGNSTDVLGRVIEVVAGQSLGAFLKTRLFDPLGMKNTSFYVTDAERQARLAEPFPGDTVTANSPLFDPRVPKAMESGGGGLMSTATDYSRFLLMLRNGGQLDGKRYVTEATLKDMTRDHLGPQVVRTALYLPGAGYGFGLGFAVRTQPASGKPDSAVGEYYWGGAAGTYMWVDPANDLFVVYMMQSPKQRVPHRAALRELVYGAVTDAKLAASK